MQMEYYLEFNWIKNLVTEKVAIKFSMSVLKLIPLVFLCAVQLPIFSTVAWLSLYQV